ncbi:MAG: homoserine dehydrogenase [Cellulomonadaceae bacterium]|nr:homoserine dehydrogenase [Cellulomonadaceae bacterium]
METPVKVALLGCGVVGGATASGLLTNAAAFAARAGAPLEIQSIVTLDPESVTDPTIPRTLLTTDPHAAIQGADIVVELLGGIEPARTAILEALHNGASVVTANKALLAEHGPELYAAAKNAGVDLFFEAAVGGAIPILRPLRESLAGDRVTRVMGIVNGTTNFVLDEMATSGGSLSLDAAVAQAQELGYAEADPTADIDGFDAAAKAAILASLAFHTPVSLSDVAREGIRSITTDDVAWATTTHHTIKLLAIAERTEQGISARVHPALVPNEHPLATVHGAFNAVWVEADAAGPLMVYGQGAGGTPTSSAVLGDIVTAARNRILGGAAPVETQRADLPILPAEAAESQFQIRLMVEDRPGVLAQVSGVLADHGISIDSVRQSAACHDAAGSGASVKDAESVGSATTHLLIATHHASEQAFAATLAEVSAQEPVREIVSCIRVLSM